MSTYVSANAARMALSRVIMKEGSAMLSEAGMPTA